MGIPSVRIGSPPPNFAVCSWGGDHHKDATRWIGFGSLTFQPSEIAKLGMVIFLAKYLVDRQNQIKYFFEGFVPPLLVVGCVCLLIVKQPDLGTAVTIAATAYVLLLVAGARLTHLGY